jgi:hypothetical protein
MSDDPDRKGFVPRAAIEYVMNKGKLEVAPDQVITVSPEPHQPSAEQRAADAEAEEKMKPPKDAAQLVMPATPVPEPEPEPSASHAARNRASRSSEE